MRITMNTVYAGVHPETGSPLTLLAGDSVDLPLAHARELIAGGFAYATDPPPAAAVVETVEKGADRGTEGAHAAEQPPARSRRRR